MSMPTPPSAASAILCGQHSDVIPSMTMTTTSSRRRRRMPKATALLLMVVVTSHLFGVGVAFLPNSLSNDRGGLVRRTVPRRQGDSPPTTPSRPLAVSPLFVTLFPEIARTSSASSSPSPGTSARMVSSPTDACPAFLIERIGGGGGHSVSTPPSLLTDKLFRTISDLCIDVFFKEELMDENGRVNLWKELQINYLKNLQAGDLRLRRLRYPDTNAMFLAYEVKPATRFAAMTEPLLLPEQLQTAFHVPRDGDKDYVKGVLLGFVEVTQRQYGIGQAGRSGSDSYTGSNSETPYRPVLTNLAVAPRARKSGIGSKLLEACELHARKEWKLNEIVLEVEDYNAKALQFYTKRGFQVIFSDPASRRYDVNGFMIKKVRGRREVLRKVFSGAPQDGNGIMNFDFFRRIRDGLRR